MKYVVKVDDLLDHIGEQSLGDLRKNNKPAYYDIIKKMRKRFLKRNK